MPTYIYEFTEASPRHGETFELFQSMKDEALTKHPESGESIRRVIQPPYIPGASSDHAARRSSNDNKRLGELGFTKYVKAGDGHYEKRAGKGPDVISRD